MRLQKFSAEYDRDLHVAFLPENLDRYAIGMPAQLDVDARLPKLQIAQHQLIEKRWKARIAQVNLIGGRIEFQPERGFDQRERRRACPGLRRTSNGIKRRPATPRALEAAEQLRQPPQVHVGRS